MEYGWSINGVDFYGRAPSREAAVEGCHAKWRLADDVTIYTGARVRDGERVGEIIVDPQSIRSNLEEEPRKPAPPAGQFNEVDVVGSPPPKKRSRKKKS